MEVAQRAFIRFREAEEGLDLIGYTGHSIAHCADSSLDTVYNAVDDVSTPLKGLSGQRFDPVDGGRKAVDDGILDVGYRRRNPGQDIGERRSDGVPNILGNARDEAPDRRKDTGDYVPYSRQDRAYDIDDAPEDVGDKLLHILPECAPIASK